MLLPKSRPIHPPPASQAQKCQMLPALVSPSPEQLLYSNVWVMQRTSHGASVAEGLRAPPVTPCHVSQGLTTLCPRLPQGLSLSLTLTVVRDSFCSAFSSPYDSFAFLMTFPVASKNRSSGKQFCKQVSSLLLGGENVTVVVIRVLFLCSGSDQLVEPLRDFSLTHGKRCSWISSQNGRLRKAICLFSFQNILFSFSFSVPPNVTSFLACSSNRLLQL